MTKYRVTYVIELDAERPAQAYTAAMCHLVDMMDRHNLLRVAEAFEVAAVLPNGGTDGATDGTLIKYELAEAGR